MELNDKEFDAAFRKKVFDAELQFEEAAWNKMEQKLKRRDRVVFFKRISILGLFLFCIAGGYYAMFRGEATKIKPTLAKGSPAKSREFVSRPVVQNQHNGPAKIVVPDRHISVSSIKVKADHVRYLSDSLVQPTFIAASLLPTNGLKLQDSSVVLPAVPEVPLEAIASATRKQHPKQANAWPVSLSLSAGPEFNSAASLIGGKGGFSAGLGLSLGITKRFKLQTGLKYSAKDYGTDGYAYAYKNEKIRALVSRIDAACAVLEVPIQASYTVLEDRRRSIDINAGMSSYFMLKEDYTFKYTAASGYKDRYTEIRNENQHYFGVVDLSATYYVKLRKEKFSFGVEPYVKVPLTGVGEGKINLKSSGIALKLRYDLGKTIK